MFSPDEEQSAVEDDDETTRSVEEMMRLTNLDLEHRLTTSLEGTHPVFTLLGDTAYERLEVLAVASPVMLCVGQGARQCHGRALE